MPDGRIARFEVAEGTTPEQAQEQMAAHFGGGSQSVDEATGADASVRAGASFKSNPEERLSYVRETLGAENVSTRQNGDIIWRRPGEKQWRAFDEAGFSLKDLADFAGDLPEIVGSIGGAVLGAGGASVPGAALGGAAGNIVKQAISKMLGGSEDARLVDRAKDVGVSALLAGGGQKVGNWAAKVLSPSAAKIAQRAYSVEGDRVAKEVGGELTQAQRTGDKGLRIIEDQGRRNFASAPIYSNFELEKQIKPATDRLDRILDRISAGGEVTDADLGKSMNQAFDKAVSVLDDARSSTAAKDFAFVDMAVGGTPIIPVTGFMQELRMLAQNYGRPGMPPGMRQGSKQASDLLDYIEEVAPDGRITASDMQAWLQNYGKAAKGRGPTVFKDMDREADKLFASRLFGALNKDLDAAAAAPNLPVPAGVSNPAKLLREARNHYREGSAAISELEASVLSKRFGRKIPTESLGRTSEWLRTLRPEEIKTAMDILDVTRPGIRQDAARNFIEEALVASREAARVGESVVERAPLRPETLLQNLPDEKVMKALLGDNAPAIKEIADVEEFLRRATDRTLSTMTLQETVPGIIARVMHSPAQAPRVATQLLFPRTMATIMTDPEAMKNLRIMMRGAGKLGGVVRGATQKFARRVAPILILESGLEATGE